MARRSASQVGGLALGNLVKGGEHFGQGCVASVSGVRAETAQALIACELLLIHSEDLNFIIQYLPKRQREAFLSNLISTGKGIMEI
mmetsp:Transcript_19142/g.27647  ORF Transcript_19142/g.27647 Transcript_19142/m.27647 type:complete len:86 (+) Transcript_19142:3-260(+)